MIPLSTDSLRSELNSLQIEQSKRAGQRDLLSLDLYLLMSELQEVSSNVDIFDMSRIFLQEVAEEARKAAKLLLEDIVTTALQYVMGPQYSLKIRLRPTQTRPEAEFLVVTTYSNSRTIESLPTLSKGGGILDILVVTIKFALLELMGIQGPMWLDEPFKHLSKEYIDPVSKLLDFITVNSGRQVILITHNAVLASLCNTSITIIQGEDGYSKFHQ